MNSDSRPRIIEFSDCHLDATVVILRDLRPPQLADEMHKMLGGTGGFFTGEAAVLDLSQLQELPDRVDWTGLLSMLRRFGLQPVGVRKAPDTLAGSVRQAGLAMLDEAESFAAPVAQTPPPTPQPAIVEPPPPPPPIVIPAKTMFVDRPVRSGQQVYAKDSDLVLLAGMSNGAEVIADGSIHCYGPLRGRALAGARGNTEARIIASNFGPELVSIAGIYRTFERGIDPDVAGRAAVVKLTGAESSQTLNIEPIQLD